jgi:predicted TIM-barrel fold metal-dependent hydrolase
MIIDAHTHLFPPGMDKVGTAEMLLAEMDACGVDKAVVLGIYPRVSNEFIAEQTQAYPDRFTGFASVNPNDGQAAAGFAQPVCEGLWREGAEAPPVRATLSRR